MYTHPHRRHRYGDWRDMTVEEVRDWLHLQVTSWWRHVTLMDLYDDENHTKVGFRPHAAGAGELPMTLPRTALGDVA